MQSLSNRTLVPIQTSVDTALHGVRLGLVVIGTGANWTHFRGAIDEVYIFDAALSQREIRTLMERNEPPTQSGHFRNSDALSCIRHSKKFTLPPRPLSTIILTKSPQTSDPFSNPPAAAIQLYRICTNCAGFKALNNLHKPLINRGK